MWVRGRLQDRPVDPGQPRAWARVRVHARWHMCARGRAAVCVRASACMRAAVCARARARLEDGPATLQAQRVAGERLRVGACARLEDGPVDPGQSRACVLCAHTRTAACVCARAGLEDGPVDPGEPHIWGKGLGFLCARARAWRMAQSTQERGSDVDASQAKPAGAVA